jgi:hypothetical protein
MRGPVARISRTRADSSDAPASVRSARAREAHPLLHPFPFAVMTLASSLVAFTLLMAGMRAGGDPQLSASTSSPHLPASPHGAVTAPRTPDATARPAAATGSPGTAVMSHTHAGARWAATETGDD